MNMFVLFLDIIFVILGYFQNGDCRPVCATNTYYDIVAVRCAPCSDICLNAHLQRTESECHSLCRGYAEKANNDVPGPIVDTTDNKSIVISIVVPIAVVAIAVIVVTVSFKEKIKYRCCPTMAVPGVPGEIGEEPIRGRQEDPNEVQPMPDDMQEEGRMQDGHLDKPEPAMGEQAVYSADDEGGADGGAAIGGADDDEVEENQALLPEVASERMEVQREFSNAVQPLQEPVGTNPIISTSVQK